MVRAVNESDASGGMLEVLAKGQSAKSRPKHNNVFAVHPQQIFRGLNENANKSWNCERDIPAAVRSADLQSAVSPNCIRLDVSTEAGAANSQPSADCKSAIQQITNLRYIGRGTIRKN
jgi:hypothetical protein